MIIELTWTIVIKYLLMAAPLIYLVYKAMTAENDFSVGCYSILTIADIILMGFFTMLDIVF